MKAKVFMGALTALIVLSFGLSPASSAPDSLTVVSSTAEAEFPSKLVFTVEVEGPADIEDVRLHYQVDRMKHMPTTSEAWPGFTPGTDVTASWTWDMRRASLPPGAKLTYWWTVTDADGSTVETIPRDITFDDERHEWQSLESRGVTLHWYEGNEEFAELLMDVCHDAIDTLAADIGTRVDRHIEVYLYPSAADLRQAMVYPQEWTGGVAFTEHGIIAIGLGPTDLEWGMRALRHELTHLVVHAATFSPYGNLPTWLDEGLAMYNEGEPAASFQSILYNAVENDGLLSLRTLSGPFSSDSTKAYLSYAESRSVVEYLLDEYGSESMHELLMAFKGGETMEDALTQTYGLGIDDLDAEWRASLQRELANA